MPTSSYEIPDIRMPAAQTHGWCLEAVEEGNAWLQAQRPTIEWSRALQMLSEPTSGADPLDGLSNLGYNKGKRIAREIVATLSNFRHAGEFKTVWNNRLHDVAHTLSNLDRHWYDTTYAHDQHRAALQYAVATGTAYYYETWDRHFHGPHKGDIRLEAKSPQDVTFVQLPKSNDIQRAYAVIIREELPLNLAKAIYSETNPAFAAALVPDRDAPGWLQKGLQAVQKFVSPALRVAGRMPSEGSRASFPTTDVFHMYVLDRSVNRTGAPMAMGAMGTNWSYQVPTLGDPLPTTQVNPATGNFFTVPAGPEDCLVFPFRRYVIFSRTGLCYDGSSPWWHGKVPVSRLRFSDWAWEALGSSQVAELKTLQDGIIALMRGIEDSAAARLDPPMIYNDQLGQSWAEAVNPRRAGVRAAAPLDQIRPMEFPVPPETYNVPNWITDWIQAQESRMDYLAAVADLVAIAKAQQIPGADTLEKLMEMAGPIVQDLVRALERPLQELGDWRKAYYLQFYTRERMITVTGPDGVPIDQQFTPDQLIAPQPGESPEMFAKRKRLRIDEFRYQVTESGINEIHRMTNKLLYIQLQKLGFPISWWTLADVCQIPNFGPPPEGTNTEMERWVAQKNIEIDLAVEQQARLQAGAAALGLGGGPGGGAGGEGGGGGAPGGGGGNPPLPGAPREEGRPSSFNAPPRLETKPDPEGGRRSTITTSR